MTDGAAPIEPSNVHPVISSGVMKQQVGLPWVARHGISIAIGLLVTPLALVATLWGASEVQMWTIRMMRPGASIVAVLVVMLGALGFVGVAASARLAGSGPALAGLLHGLIPGFLAMLAPSAFLEMNRAVWGLTSPVGQAMVAFSPATQAVLGGLLMGVAVSGRWGLSTSSRSGGGGAVAARSHIFTSGGPGAPPPFTHGGV